MAKYERGTAIKLATKISNAKSFDRRKQRAVGPTQFNRNYTTWKGMSFSIQLLKHRCVRLTAFRNTFRHIPGVAPQAIMSWPARPMPID